MGNTSKRVKGAAKEIGGKIQKKTGQAVGSEHLENEGRAREAEGHAEKEAAKARERAKGKAEKIGGRVERGAGRLFEDDEMEAEGELHRVQGETRQKANR